MAAPHTFGDAFRGKRSQLIKYLDVSQEFLILLLDIELISKTQKQDIEGQTTVHDKISRLLEILERRPDHLYPYFCQALDQSGQSHVTDILRRPAGNQGYNHYVAPPVSNPSYGGHQSQRRPNPSNSSNYGPSAAAFPTTHQQYGAGPAPAPAPAPTPAPAPAPAQTNPAPQPSQTRADHSSAHARLRTEIIPADVKTVAFTELSNPVQIAEGGFGIIYRAGHADWGTVAFKKLKVAVINPGDKTARELQKEAQAQCLRHQNIVSILGIVFEPGNYGVVMEYAMFRGLDDFIAKYQVEVLMKMHLAHGVVLGMNYLHTYTRNGQPSPVIHGDLKTQNVLVADGYVAKICDFGLTKWKQFSTTKTGSRTERGTVSHIPPETWKDINRRRDTKYDIYSFGILMYELLSESLAFAAATSTDEIRMAVMSGQRPAIQDITCDQQDAGEMINMITDMIKTFWAQEPGDRPEFLGIKEIFDGFMQEFEAKVAVSRAHLDAETIQATRS